MLRQLFRIKRDFDGRSDNLDSLIGQVRDMSFRQGQICEDLKESLSHAETVLQRCELHRKEVG